VDRFLIDPYQSIKPSEMPGGGSAWALCRPRCRLKSRPRREAAPPTGESGACHSYRL